MKQIAIVSIFILLLTSAAIAENRLPTDDEIGALILECSEERTKSIEDDLTEAMKIWRDQAKRKGKAEIDDLDQIIISLKDEQLRLEAYRLYTACLKDAVGQFLSSGKIEVSPLTPRPRTISLGIQPRAFDLELISKSSERIAWTAEKNDKFELSRNSGTIAPNETGIIRVEPVLERLPEGSIEEKLWFRYHHGGEEKRFAVAVHAVKPENIQFTVHDVNDELYLSINGVDVTSSPIKNSGWSIIIPSRFLHIGDNFMDIRLHNVASRRGGSPWGEREGWSYHFTIKAGQTEMSFKDVRSSPSTEEWGKTFTVKKLIAFLDGSSGRIAIR